jgi:hypothetical protein
MYVKTTHLPLVRFLAYRLSFPIGQLSPLDSSETSVEIQLRTRQYILEDSELHTRRRENFKSHLKQPHFKCKNVFTGQMMLWETSKELLRLLKRN